MKKKASSHETAASETPPPASGPLTFCAFTRLVDVAELKPNPKNPKRHPRRQLEVYAKILGGGWRRPIVVSNRSGLIVKGHGAYEAARDVLKADLVPVDFQDYATEEAELADLLADNKLAELAENDESALAELLGELTGRIDLELAGILASIEAETPAAPLKALDVPPAPEMTWVLIGIPTVRFGDINAQVEKIARVPQALVETTFQSAPEEEGEAMPTKTDNHNLAGKLALRRHFLKKYHADGDTRVFDCCQATGRIWNELRREFPVAGYWGVDLKPKKGRLKVDSVRILGLPGFAQNVVDIDTYGSPWKHWTALLPNAPDRLTVFLTIGLVKMAGGNYDRSILPALGITFTELKLPQQFGVRLGELGVTTCLAQARKHGFDIVECMEAENDGGTARYIGVRLERVKP